jgi:hypothetical protein
MLISKNIVVNDPDCEQQCKNPVGDALDFLEAQRSVEACAKIAFAVPRVSFSRSDYNRATGRFGSKQEAESPAMRYWSVQLWAFATAGVLPWFLIQKSTDDRRCAVS